jgi:hypothetical protein
MFIPVDSIVMRLVQLDASSLGRVKHCFISWESRSAIRVQGCSERCTERCHAEKILEIRVIETYV